MNKKESLECNDIFQRAMMLFSGKFEDETIDKIRLEVLNYLDAQRNVLSEKYYGNKYKNHSKENLGI